MKDALAIINRIIHDPAIDQNDFEVGYEDRFAGVVFSRFKDYLRLDLPSHRIRYIMYDRVVVWSRGKRIDRLGFISPIIANFSLHFSKPSKGSLIRVFPPHATGPSPYPLRLPNFDTLSSNLKIVAVSVGVEHTLCLTSKAECYGFGLSSFRQIPLSTSSSKFKQQEATLLATNVLSISAGGRSSLLVTFDHSVYACGRNDYGQLGVYNTSLFSTVTWNIPDPVGHFGPVCVASLTRVSSLDSLNIVKVAAGETHSLALSNEGLVYSLGDNTRGACGYGQGSLLKDTVDEPVTVALPTTAVDVSVGRYHSVVLLIDGSVVTFGCNDCQQLGRAHLFNDFRPFPVDSLIDPFHDTKTEARKALQIAAGAEHTLVLMEGGDVVAFGKSSKGQCGVSCKRAAPGVITALSKYNIVKVFAGFGISGFVTDEGVGLVIGGPFSSNVRSFVDNFYVSGGFGLHKSYLISSAVEGSQSNVEMDQNCRSRMIEGLGRFCMSKYCVEFSTPMLDCVSELIDFPLVATSFPSLTEDLITVSKGGSSDIVSKVSKMKSDWQVIINATVDVPEVDLDNLHSFIYSGKGLFTKLVPSHSLFDYSSLCPVFDPITSSFERPLYSDFCISTPNFKVYCHRVFLACSCKFFASLFSAGTLDSNLDTFSVDSLDAVGLSVVLSLVYSGKLPLESYSFDNLLHALLIADQWSCSEMLSPLATALYNVTDLEHLTECATVLDRLNQSDQVENCLSAMVTFYYQLHHKKLASLPSRLWSRLQCRLLQVGLPLAVLRPPIEVE
ncbi:hypothetical protein RCL1_003295 [Eukaryota sp. TZLM3-RCL]